MQQPVGVMRLQVSGHALGTKTSLVDRKIVTRLKADELVFFDEQIHPALYGAVRTMRRDDFVDGAISLPTVDGRIVEVRTVLLDYPFEVLYFTH
jgi:hypothetical protein